MNPITLKEMLVIVAIATIVFVLAKPLALHFSSETDFDRRRNVWLVLTVSAFLSPSFWIWALLAVPLITWAAARDSNPVAFYLLMLFVIPAILIDIPVVVINRLFELDIYRVLAFCVLIPTAWRLVRTRRERPGAGFDLMDWLLLAYGALQLALFMPYESSTNTLRRAFLFILDVYVLYFVVSRVCSSRRVLAEAMAAFCLAVALMAPLAVWETVRHWLLYTDLTQQWHGVASQFYSVRGGVLRAQASTGSPLALGYLLAVGFGFWLYLKSRLQSATGAIATAWLLWLGLLAAYSRGPWLGAVMIYFAYAALNPQAVSGLFKALGVAILAVACLGMSPLWSKIAGVLPFLGGRVDYSSMLYREELLERSWLLFQQHPWFGDPFVLTQMEDLRQGQGIIDLVNGYVQVGLFSGLAGLTLFVGFITSGLLKILRLSRSSAAVDPDLARLGASLGACILGTLLMIASCSLILGYEKMFYVLAGLATAYGRLAPAVRRARSTAQAPVLASGAALHRARRYPEAR